MKISKEITVNVSVDKAWDLIGENFGGAGDFSSVLHGSHLEGELDVGAKRVCDLGKKKTAVETIIQFDRQARVLTYVLSEGLPPFMMRAQNKWEVIEKGPNTTVLRITPIMDIKWWGLPLVPLMMVSVGPLLTRFLEEAKHLLETGTLHPRAKKQKAKLARLTPAHG